MNQIERQRPPQKMGFASDGVWLSLHRLLVLKMPLSRKVMINVAGNTETPLPISRQLAYEKAALQSQHWQ
ncbi:hypothetical protein [Pseudomonas gingeri]|uniref:hypothetical protein n=1 Tax=Pseudomonas gingeri TaxID=117681 RepID=UPI0015A07419|nr:hypothetical protein [Pseudomonas gingeri]NWA06783.1 hypothetical protein [Pseudomonas gingeri]